MMKSKKNKVVLAVVYLAVGINAILAQDTFKARNNDPIAVFDSGTGGFTVLEKMLCLDYFNNKTHEIGPDNIPDFKYEDFEYLADQANMPYGRYSMEGNTDFLKERIKNDASFVLGKNYYKSPKDKKPTGVKKQAKIIVIACNTATAYGLKLVENMLDSCKQDVKVIGVVNAGAKCALENFKDKKSLCIGVLATPGTISSGVYERTLKEMAENKERKVELVVISQAGDGFAEAVDGEKSFVDERLHGFSSNYMGPKIGITDADIKVDLLKAYNFSSDSNKIFIQKDEHGRINRIELNAAENYAKFHLVSLLEKMRHNGTDKPLDCIILGCTHYPFYLNTLKEELDYLKHYRLDDGTMPYNKLISEHCIFIDPADYTAIECYRLLHDQNLFSDKKKDGFLQTFITIPSAYIDKCNLDNDGNLSYKFKFGRKAGKDLGTTPEVEMTPINVGAATLERIKSRLPACYEKIMLFFKCKK